MADSLRDLLLKSGIVKQVHDNKVQEARAKPPQAGRPEYKGAKPAHSGGKPHQQQGKASRAPHKDQSEIDLAKAYAIRAQTRPASASASSRRLLSRRGCVASAS